MTSQASKRFQTNDDQYDKADLSDSESDDSDDSDSDSENSEPSYEKTSHKVNEQQPHSTKIKQESMQRPDSPKIKQELRQQPHSPTIKQESRQQTHSPNIKQESTQQNIQTSQKNVHNDKADLSDSESDDSDDSDSDSENSEPSYEKTSREVNEQQPHSPKIKQESAQRTHPPTKKEESVQRTHSPNIKQQCKDDPEYDNQEKKLGNKQSHHSRNNVHSNSPNLNQKLDSPNVKQKNDNQQNTHDISVNPQISSKAKSMMEKMGWDKRSGLGKGNQGIRQPIEASGTFGRMGLGGRSEFKRQEHKYTDLKLCIDIKPNWLKIHTFTHSIEDFFEIQSTDISNKTVTNPRFCEIVLQHEVMDCKTMFDACSSQQFYSGRERANPFEKIKKEMFQNRAALKMAEMDALCSRLFTFSPLLKQESLRTKKRQLLYFADICAGPGGFSEYMFTVLKWRARGFGFTLRGGCDWKVNKFNRSAPAHSFSTHYGVDDSGDIYKKENIENFIREVKKGTHGKGVHLVMGDGGINTDGNENQQELMTQRLILCQFLTALSILRKGGVFVCKVFSTYLPLTVDLLYILRLQFHEFCILKPNQSRPANSEKFVVCKGYLGPKQYIIDLLFKTNTMIEQRKNVISLVKELKMDHAFCTYIKKMNTTLTLEQIAALRRLKEYIEDSNLRPDDQDKIRLECLAHWSVSSNGRRYDVIEDNYSPPQKERIVYYDPTWGEKIFRKRNSDRRYSRNQTSTQWKDPLTFRGERIFELLMKEMKMANHFYPLVKKDDPNYGKWRDQLDQITNLGDWFIFVLPENGERCYLISTPTGIWTKNRDGITQLMMEHVPNLPTDLIFDVIVLKGEKPHIFILDAWTLPSNNPDDIDFYKMRPKFSSRKEMINLFLESINPQGSILEFRSPWSLYHGNSGQKEFKDSAMFTVKNIDIYFIRANGKKPSPSRVWRWRYRKNFPLSRLKVCIDYIITKRLSKHPGHSNDHGKKHKLIKNEHNQNERYKRHKRHK